MVKYRKRSKNKIPKGRSKLARTRPSAVVRTGYLKTAQKIATQFNVSSANPETGISSVFKLSDIPQNAVFARLFDSYRINKIVVKAYPLTNNTATINPNYTLLSAIDLDDGNTPTKDSIIERSNCKIQPIIPAGNTSQMKTWTIRPRYLTQLYEGAVGTGYGQGSRSQWLDCADPDIPHFGLKLVFDTNPLLNTSVLWQFYTTYYVEFKSLR